jgi:hypothetical protein
MHVVLLMAILLTALAPDRATAFQDAYLPVAVDSGDGDVHLTVRNLGEDLYYMNALAQGLGSLEPIRLDRGGTGDVRIVRFERRGPRVLLIQRNVDKVASSGDAGEVQAVEESFAPSILASMPIVEESADGLVVDATDFLLSDVWDVVGSAQRAGVGPLRLDRDRSFIVEEQTYAFPRNTEVRATLTYATDTPHTVFRQHAPDGRAVTLQQHHSFVPITEPPLPNRHYDPRTGNSARTVEDYSQPFDGEFRLRSVARWRLVPSDPAAYQRGELVEPVTPIVIHLDPGIPEPYRSAYREGALWWNTAFEAAGFRNAFQVQDLPDGVHQMDARYSVLQAVHRTGPGPSTGNSFRDPRTGEMLQALTQMDTYRSLVDFNIYAGLLPAFDAQGVTPQLTAEEFAMMRRKQHTAHELGHAIGLPHNHSAAAQARASVMDYPFPLIELTPQGNLDVSNAYRDGIGYSDSLAVRYAYTWYPDAEAEREGLAAIAQEALDRGHRFITGGYARDLAGSQPDSHMWWEGDEPFEALDRATAVRRVILEHFDERAIRPGEPMAWLNHRLAHAYLHHRYQVEAVVKYIGGMWFEHALRDDGQTPREVIPAAEQRRALDRILDVLSPREIAVPERIIDLIPPTPEGYDDRVPWIPTPAGPALDAQAIARSFAQEVVDNVLHRERVARVAAFHARDSGQLSLDELFGGLVDATWGAARPASHTERAYTRGAERAVLDGLFTLVADDRVTSEVKNGAERHLALLAERLGASPGQDAEEQAQRARARREIERYMTLGEVPPLRTGVIELFLPWP